VITGAWPSSAKRGEKRADQLFLAELARVRASARSRRERALRELFDYLAARGPDALPATQADIADSVFGQPDTEGDDATGGSTSTVCASGSRSSMPAKATGRTAPGSCCRPALTCSGCPPCADEDAAAASAAPPGPQGVGFGLALAAALVATFLLGRALPSSADAPPANAFWQPFLDSDRPIVVVVGDYYMFGEFDPVEPEQSRLIRDFRVRFADGSRRIAGGRARRATAMPRTSV
jgi:hypothetical protein